MSAREVITQAVKRFSESGLRRDSYHMVVFRAPKSGEFPDLVFSRQLPDGCDLDSMLRRICLYAFPADRSRRATPVVVRELPADSERANSVFSVGDFYSTVADLNEDLGLHRYEVNTYRKIQKAANRGEWADLGGIKVSFATAEEIERVERALSGGRGGEE